MNNSKYEYSKYLPNSKCPLVTHLFLKYSLDICNSCLIQSIPMIPSTTNVTAFPFSFLTTGNVIKQIKTEHGHICAPK